jgi:WD40 repeat protein
VFRTDDPHIRSELLLMIVQYLEDSGYFASALNLRDEVRLRVAQGTARGKQLVKIRDAMTSGDWSRIENLTASACLDKHLLYSIFRHRFYDLLAQDDPMTALNFLATRLREYRIYEDVPGDFDRLCLTLVEVVSPSQSPPLPDVGASAAKIIEVIDHELQFCGTPLIEEDPAPHRLLSLLDQAISFQCGDFPPDGSVVSLISDYCPSVIPVAPAIELCDGHKDSVKAIAFVPGSNTLLSGSSDQRICVWNTAKREKVGFLKGHAGRIWSIAAGDNCAVTGSSDGTVRLWEISSQTQLALFSGHIGDVYSVDIEAGGRRIVSGGYDQSIIVWDAPTQVPEASLKGHREAVTSVLFDRSGQFVVSGGSDLTLQVWDIRTCLATMQLLPVLGEVTSVAASDSFGHILAATKDNTNRIWDLRFPSKFVVLKGHQNSSKHFVRARFGPDGRTVLSGSDDGKIYIWEALTGKLIDRIQAHGRGVMDIVWCPHNHMFASCGDDTTVMLWPPSECPI